MRITYSYGSRVGVEGLATTVSHDVRALHGAGLLAKLLCVYAGGPRGDAFRLYLILYATLRILLDPLRGDGRPERFLGLSHQQGIALAVILLAVAWPKIAAAARLGWVRAWRKHRDTQQAQGTTP